MTKIISNSGSLILNDTSSMAIGLLRCRVEGDYVLVSDGGSIQWKLNYKETTVDGDSFDSSEDLLSTISSFNKGGGNGPGVAGLTWGDTSMMPEAGKVPIFSPQGLLSTGMPLFPENAVPLVLLDVRIPSAPASGTYILKSVDGIVSWVAE